MERKQLTLFLDEGEAQSIEGIRRKFNPVQYHLIKSHITLCREDEIEDLAPILQSLEQLRVEPFELITAPPERFSQGKGVFIPIQDQAQHFQKLREKVLRSTGIAPRMHEPHITLMHPRNSSCDDAAFEEILKVRIPKVLNISNISLIRQEIGKAWKVLAEYPLENPKHI